MRKPTIYFVGMHNKPGMQPLDSRTKTGKLIDKIIYVLQENKCVKTNLYNTDYRPNIIQKFDLAMDWHHRIKPSPDDIIVLLGTEVHEHYVKTLEHRKIIKIPHPASRRSHESITGYILYAVEEINKYLWN